jgi:dCMP deaminase
VLLAAFNTHLPSQQSAYVMGDPRGNFKPGECIDASLAAHGEVSVIAEAANRGLSTKGCDLYVTTFPCPPCAASVALSGVHRVFYIDGYSRIEGAAALISRGVQIVRVELNTPPA